MRWLRQALCVAAVASLAPILHYANALGVILAYAYVAVILTVSVAYFLWVIPVMFFVFLYGAVAPA